MTWDNDYVVALYIPIRTVYLPGSKPKNLVTYWSNQSLSFISKLILFKRDVSKVQNVHLKHSLRIAKQDSKIYEIKIRGWSDATKSSHPHPLIQRSK